MIKKKKRKKFQSPLLIERDRELATPRYPFIFLTTKLGKRGEGERLEEVFRVLRSRIKPDWIGILNVFPVRQRFVLSMFESPAWSLETPSSEGSREGVLARRCFPDSSTSWESFRARKMMEGIIHVKRLNSTILEWPEITAELSSRCASRGVFSRYFSRAKTRRNGLPTAPPPPASCGFVVDTASRGIYVPWVSLR